MIAAAIGRLPRVCVKTSSSKIEKVMSDRHRNGLSSSIIFGGLIRVNSQRARGVTIASRIVIEVDAALSDDAISMDSKSIVMWTCRAMLHTIHPRSGLGREKTLIEYDTRRMRNFGILD